MYNGPKNWRWIKDVADRNGIKYLSMGFEHDGTGNSFYLITFGNKMGETHTLHFSKEMVKRRNEQEILDVIYVYQVMES